MEKCRSILYVTVLLLQFWIYSIFKSVLQIHGERLHEGERVIGYVSRDVWSFLMTRRRGITRKGPAKIIQDHLLMKDSQSSCWNSQALSSPLSQPDDPGKRSGNSLFFHRKIRLVKPRKGEKSTRHLLPQNFVTCFCHIKKSFWSQTLTAIAHVFLVVVQRFTSFVVAVMPLIRLDLPKFGLPQEIEHVWKSVEDLFSFLAQSHLEAVRESTGEGVWSSDHCREAGGGGGERSLSAGPQSDYSPFSPIWTGHGRFGTLFSNEARHKLRPFWSITDGIDHIWRFNPVRSGIYTQRLPFDALWAVSETTAAFRAFLLAVQHPFRSVSDPVWLSIIGAGIMFLW